MYSQQEEIFVTYNGLTIPMWYRKDTNDYNTIVSIFKNDEYQTKIIPCQRGDTFIDLGAHIGSWSSLIQHLVQEANIIAVEPLPENREMLKKNAIERVLDYAISNKSGLKKKIYYADDSEFGCHHKFVGNTVSDHRGNEFYESTTISLNDLFRDISHCRVLKVDIEGAEHASFPFFSRETLEKIDYIVGECHNPTQDPKKTRSALFKYTRGLFEDISTGKDEGMLTHFFFKRHGI